MPRIDVTTVPASQGSGYPKPFDAPCSARTRRRLRNGVAADADAPAPEAPVKGEHHGKKHHKGEHGPAADQAPEGQAAEASDSPEATRRRRRRRGGRGRGGRDGDTPQVAAGTE